jgi:hypothetical protein
MTEAQIKALAIVFNLACEHGEGTKADREGLTYDTTERNALDMVRVMLQTARNEAR